MPLITIHKNGEVFEGEVQPNTNLVVRAGIRQFPYPHLSYGCGMGKCAKCMCKVLKGGEALPEPNWKEKKMLGERLEQGYRLACQLWVEEDLELAQDSAAGSSQPSRASGVTAS
ncbi:2Fe-2S iron-sulfur cluster-binding protein [Halomonas sp. MCCC 1A11062]|uniref:2Fe-2S iron-sulfur cluster-binding protein n=1 Tax=Halomonas sp. MCCC 1A11062 TaxID=2733485 RepID=UPI001F1862A9|nr:2Fe-2S iron-sulfur cluster-binding protein [Halomonas sp. MCCC 1A11062]MCE8037918.1 (2Fe-2S)-binding protein [Halomonas sp. MCCC 1A11062]